MSVKIGDFVDYHLSEHTVYLALVVHVSLPYVNLTVFDENGAVFGQTHVPFITPGEDFRPKDEDGKVIPVIEKQKDKAGKDIDVDVTPSKAEVFKQVLTSFYFAAPRGAKLGGSDGTS